MHLNMTPGDAPEEAAATAPAAHGLHLQTLATPFIGRERQVAQVCELLDRASVCLLTLVGPGGIGKTRLVVAVAEALRSKFPGGVCYVSLAPLTDASLVLPAIAQALGMRDTGALTGQSLLGHLTGLVGNRKLLIVLDNFEQVIEAAAGVAGLLRICPHLKIIVTSREILRISAEHCYDVPPLTLPNLQRLPPPEYLAHVEAVRLFVTRAQAAQPDFMLTQANAGAVAAICHRLDGLPLAIELAASRIRLLPPLAMLGRLEQRLTWLTGGPRDAPARHQTLRAAVGWSYDLLEPHEQRLFRRLAVFAGGCTLEAASSVCASMQGEPTEDVLQAAASLLDKSLLRNEEFRQENGGSAQDRLYMLETIREYALEKLESGKDGEAEAMRRAHANYYAALAEEAESELTGPDQSSWLARLEQEHDNMRAALGWATGVSATLTDGVIGARLAAALWRFWLIHGHLSEGWRWFETILAQGRTLPPTLRARALNGAGRLALRHGDYGSAQASLEESLHLLRASDDTKNEMQAIHSLGLVALYRNDLPQAQSYFEQNLERWRLLGDKLGMVQTLNNLGLTLRYQGEFERAAEVYEECLTLARELQNKYGTGAALHNLGQMAHHRGDDVQAHHLLSESLVIGREIGDRPNIPARLSDLAGVWVTQGKPERAARLFGAAEALSESVQAPMYEAQRLAYESDVRRGAAQLDADAWAAGWTEGRAMSIDDACALALEPLPDASSEATAPPAEQNTYDLTERELEVLRLLVAGLTYAEIGEKLMVSFHTVHSHMRSIYAKLGVTSRNQATHFSIEHGLS